MNTQKFKTPIELHRKLGNTYQIQVYERNLMRKQVRYYCLILFDYFYS